MMIIESLLGVVIQLIGLYQLVLVVYILSSWFPQLRSSQLVGLLGQLCEPYLILFRGLVPLLGGLDLSALLALMLLSLVRSLLVQIQVSVVAF